MVKFFENNYIQRSFKKLTDLFGIDNKYFVQMFATQPFNNSSLIAKCGAIKSR